MNKAILGVDASTVNIGWAVLDYNTEYLIHHGCVSFNPAKHEYYFRLKNGPKMLFAEVPLDGVEVLAIEHSFFSKNALTGKAITMMVGCVIYEAFHRGIKIVRELSPTEIKKAYVNQRWADKSAIQNSVLFEFGIEISEDEADAVATAKAYMLLDKTGAFQKREDKKREKRYDAAMRAKKKRADKNKRNLEGELKLW